MVLLFPPGDGEEFELKLGRMRSAGSARGRKYLSLVIASAMRAGGYKRAGRGRFTGGRLGRGGVAARLLASRGRHGPSGRRAIVKVRLVRLSGQGLGAARAHLRYIQRDGVQRDGSPGQLYSADFDIADGQDFIETCAGDRHQFRLILSAEDGAAFDDLKPLVRRFMARMEEDLGTRLQWVAADHRDTAYPHTHVILRGKDVAGANLVIARDYLSRGMRERLAELVTLDLGPRSELETTRTARLEVGAERLTRIDRQLLRDARGGHAVRAGSGDPFQQALRSGRLKKLEALGLARDLGGGWWKLDPRLDDRLRKMSERGDIVRTMQRALAAAGVARGPAGQIIHGAGRLERPVVGRVIDRGLSDELADRHYLVLDAADGRIHYVDIGRAGDTGPLPIGAIVRVAPAAGAARAADRIVAEIASANAGVYSFELHRRYDPSASEEFVRANVRRLEALRRGGAGVERRPGGCWIVASDHLVRAAAFEARKPVRLELLSPLALGELVGANAATWLDLQLGSDEPEALRDCGFGRDVRAALALRRQWLIDERLIAGHSSGTRVSKEVLATLRRRERLAVAAKVAGSLGIPYREAEPGGRIEGRFERRLDLPGGRLALIVGDREFTLVPWRAALDRWLGREIALSAGARGIGWSAGRGRSGPEIG
jgi:type IV secretory pathway VirD2 relaxase